MSDEPGFGMTKESCTTASLELKADLFWLTASQSSVPDHLASCTWEEYYGNRSMCQRTAVYIMVSTEQRL